jgi:hypothetical protein
VSSTEVHRDHDLAPQGRGELATTTAGAVIANAVFDRDGDKDAASTQDAGTPSGRRFGCKRRPAASAGRRRKDGTGLQADA